MTHPIQNVIGAVFVPVRHIEKAKEWYCSILGLPNEGEILSGHLFIVPMQGTSALVLDSKIFSQESVYTEAAFHFNTSDIEAAYSFMKQQNVELVTEIEHGHWFNFKDPDGNVLMVCKC